ncbi:MAG: ROK family protein [Ginsengibacter sp.]
MEKNDEKILCIDIGGSHIKATIIDYDGKFLQKYEREKTPSPPSPENVVKLILELAGRFPQYDKVTAGFPGYVKNGIVKTAPKLGNDIWRDFDLKNELQSHLKKPTLVINDADLQGLSLAEGKGVEILITLGTGFGSAIMNDGVLTPHLEMSQHPVTKTKNYNDYVSASALEKVGNEKWNKRMKKVIEILRVVFNFDHLYISGGSAKLITFKLDDDITIVNNRDGIKGGMVLWKQFDEEDLSKNIK